jgi:hypothetical protein
VLAEREQRGLWTPGNIPKGKPRNRSPLLEIQQIELVLQESRAAYTAGPKAKFLRKKGTKALREV